MIGSSTFGMNYQNIEYTRTRYIIYKLHLYWFSPLTLRPLKTTNEFEYES